MAWYRVDIGTKLLMAVGEGSPVICTGTPVYFRDAADTISQTPAQQYNASGFYSGATKPIYDDIVTIHGSGGIGLWSTVNALTAGGDTLKIWNANLGKSVYLEIRRQNASTAQFRTVNHDAATEWRTLTDFTQPSQGYGSMPEPSMNIGFLQNEDDNTIVLLTQRTYSNNANTYHYYYINSAAIDAVDSANFIIMLSDIPPTPEQPYEQGGFSEPGGGDGTYDDTSDTVTMPGLPGLNLSINGFVTAYAPTLTQINDLATFIWSDWLSGGPTLPKIFANPEDAVISLHMLPFEPSTSSAIEVTVGHFASGVNMDPMTNQFYTINCGSLAIDEYWGNYLDYNPYTKLTLFLPYVGEITLNPDEVMTRTITIKYRVDAMTGAFVAFILRDDDKIIGEYQGNCSLQVPISSANYAQLHSALLGLAGSAVGMAAGAAGSGISGLLSGGTNVLTSAAGMMDSKVRHSHSGALGSASGFMGSQTPYLIIERARQCLPDGLNRFAGYPSQITETLGELSGFTSVSEIVLDGIPLTDEELTELREILKGGVYL